MSHQWALLSVIKAKSNKQFINENIEKSARDLIVHFVQVQLFAW